MAIISSKNFKHNSSIINSSQRVYKGILLDTGPTFSLSNQEAALCYCENFNLNCQQGICLIVKDRNFLQIWLKEGFRQEQKEEVSSNDSVDSTNSNQVVLLDNTNNLLPLEPDFLDQCDRILAEYIGPLAPVICKRTIAKNPGLNRQQFVEIIAQKIPDTQQEINFKQALLE